MKMRTAFAALVAALSIGAGLFFATDHSSFAQQVPAARQNTTQQTNYYRKTVTFNEAYAGGNRSIRIGRLPANAFIKGYSVQVSTAFVGGASNRIYLGAGNFANTGPAATISAANNVLAAATDGGIIGNSWTSGTIGFTPMLTGANFGTRLTSGGEVDLWANYAGGSAPTAGSATFIVEYIPDNDL